MARYETNDDSVVVIIGSGAGGGTLANELCQKGLKVVLLEAGGAQSPATFRNDEWFAFNQLAWLDKRTTSGTWRVAKDFPNLPAWTCKTLGGTTVHWAGASLRFQEHEFKARTTYSNIKGANLLDWPLTLAELAPYYAKAEDKMGVTRTNDIPGLPGNNNFKVMYNGATRAGYKTVHTGRMAINSRPRDDRSACWQLGFCFQGCKSGAKWSTLYTEIPKAQETGRLDLRTQAQVLRVEHDKSGKVTEVLYADKDGKHVSQKARVVCVACNSIESARLLLNSHSSQFPHGLANSSGEVGHNYMRHTTGSVFGLFKQPVHMYRGTVMAGIIQDEAELDTKRGFAGGFEFETISLGLPFTAAFLNPSAWGRAYARQIEQFNNMAAMWIVGEDMPQSGNSITLHPSEKDQFGLPIPNVHYDDHENDLAMRNYAFKRGAAIYDAVGAIETIKVPPYPSTHNMGTCRMSANPRDGVCNKWGQTHDIKNLFISDGSQFTTSGAENPTLTIVTLAIRQAEYIAAESSKRNI
ncbi:MAG TPA: GMC family oxidoreductase [Candidatus Binataceae bacterium]|nr:GMC family oxidoreductase [Candidatus Binataceae bacterium]